MDHADVSDRETSSLRLPETVVTVATGYGRDRIAAWLRRVQRRGYIQLCVVQWMGIFGAFMMCTDSALKNLHIHQWTRAFRTVRIYNMLYLRYVISVPDRFRQALIERLMGLGSLGVEEGEGTVTAYFPAYTPAEMVLTELSIIRELITRSGEPGTLSVQSEVIPDQDWNESWKRNFKPIAVGERFVILPPWESYSGDRIPLVIDPGMAFGTGHHETTRSCLLLMERYVAQVSKERFLDLGTGTGLLAIAALKLGFRSVEAIDTDAQAIEAARKNIAVNQAGRVVLKQGDISMVEGIYDMIAANLISGVLAALAGDIAKHLDGRGVAILSGILLGQEDEVIGAMERSGLRCTERLVDGKWISLVVRR